MKSIEDYEREYDIQLRGVDDPKKEVSRDEFISLRDANGFAGVDHKQREAWLVRNGHAVTRENLANPNLSPNKVKGGDK